MLASRLKRLNVLLLSLLCIRAMENSWLLPLTIAEIIRTTLTGSPQPDGGVPLLCRTKSEAGRTPLSN